MGLRCDRIAIDSGRDENASIVAGLKVIEARKIVAANIKVNHAGERCREWCDDQRRMFVPIHADAPEAFDGGGLRTILATHDPRPPPGYISEP